MDRFANATSEEMSAIFREEISAFQWRTLKEEHNRPMGHYIPVAPGFSRMNPEDYFGSYEY
jgi:hypothetical protein